MPHETAIVATVYSASTDSIRSAFHISQCITFIHTHDHSVHVPFNFPDLSAHLHSISGSNNTAAGDAVQDSIPAAF
jgi:hypothetical protein